MTPTPTLPPLPPPEIVELGGKKTAYYAVTTLKLQKAAYQAGRDAGLEEAARACDKQGSEPECPERATYCADAIRALKSDAKERKP